MQKAIQCPCGVTLRAEDDDTLVSTAQTHARDTHQMALSRDEALAMAIPEPDREER